MSRAERHFATVNRLSRAAYTCLTVRPVHGRCINKIIARFLSRRNDSSVRITDWAGHHASCITRNEVGIFVPETTTLSCVVR
jgi:hypothetical protein